MQPINLKLQGQFKFDLYRPDGELIKSSDYIDNFITNSGVLYPYHFAFADCFRFLSVGTGTLYNSILPSDNPTTGLSGPLSGYHYIGGRSNFNSGFNASYYATPGNFGAGCGFVNNNNGVSLIRQWNLPDNTGGTFTGSQTFTEFMVTPGRPYVTGIGGAPFCSSFDFDTAATGLDNSSTANYYEFLANKYRTINHSQRLLTCDATAAFARVLYEFDVVPNSILTITYRLNVIVDTGVKFTSLFYNRGDNVPNWNQFLDMYSSITQPGVMLINDGATYDSIAPNNQTRLQHFDYTNGSTQYNFNNEYGESFVPPMGAPLEPSNYFLLNDPNNQNVVVYISEDNLQFMVNPYGGAFTDTGHYAPWNFWQSSDISTTFSFGDMRSSGNFTYEYIGINPSAGNFLTNGAYWQNLGYLQVIKAFSSGVMPFRNDNDATLNSGGSYWSVRSNSFNTRINSGTYPNPTGVTNSVPMGSRMFAATKANLPSLVFSVPSTGTRNASVVYTYSFENYTSSSSLDAKSFVAAYRDLAYGAPFGVGDKVNMVPFFDALFSGISGNPSGFFIPGILTGIDTFGNTGATISGFEVGTFNTLDGASNSLYPIFNTSLTWSVPCPNGVHGC